MKSTPHGSVPNMRGRKTHVLSCGCCSAFDLRDKYRERLAEREIRDVELELEQAKSNVCDEILSIMEEYDRQNERGFVDTPGGLEHMGDVWRLLKRWQKILSP